MKRLNYTYLTAFATLLALVVVLLGAFTRLADAGLGCPDWPGCYGQILVPHTKIALAKVAKIYPEIPVETGKAWAEMIHRYVAGILGLLILWLAVYAIMVRRSNPRQAVGIPCMLVGLLVFQAVLGMWTVTWKLYPLVVMGHLIGGMTITSLLWWLTVTRAQRTLNSEYIAFRPRYPGLAIAKPWLWIGLIIVVLQIVLGGWTSSNYAALVCTDFPYCHGQLFPAMDFAHGFNFFSPIGANYQGGTLAIGARVAIQMMHRYGAAITVTYIGGLILYLFFSGRAYGCRHFGWLLFVLLSVQISLGILNVLLLLPLPIAVAHNGFAVLLLLAMVTLLGLSRKLVHD